MENVKNDSFIYVDSNDIQNVVKQIKNIKRTKKQSDIMYLDFNNSELTIIRNMNDEIYQKFDIFHGYNNNLTGRYLVGTDYFIKVFEFIPENTDSLKFEILTNILHVTGFNYYNKMNLSERYFDFEYNSEPENIIKFTNSEILDNLINAENYISKENYRKSLEYLKMEFNSGINTNQVFYASDGYRIIKTEQSSICSEIADKKDNFVIIPKSVIKGIIALIKGKNKNQNIEINYNHENVIIKNSICENYQIIIQRMDRMYSFPNVMQCIPSEIKTCLQVCNTDLLNGLKAIKNDVDMYKSVTIYNNKKDIILKSENQMIGLTGFIESDSDFEICLNYDYLLHIAKNAGKNSVLKIEGNSKNTIFKITDTNNSSVLQVVCGIKK